MHIKKLSQIFFLFGILWSPMALSQKFECPIAEEKRIDKFLLKNPTNYNSLTAKGICQIVRNRPDLALITLKKAKMYKGVHAAWLVARHIESAGTFKDVKNKLKRSELLDPSIVSYRSVLNLMNSVPNYPHRPENIDYALMEMKYSLKIDTLFQLAILHYWRASNHMEDHMARLAQSAPSYKQRADQIRSKLKFYPVLRNNLGPIHDINQLETATNACLREPYFEGWNKEHYEIYIYGCKGMKNFANAVRPLELRRISLGEACKDILTNESKNCQEYHQVFKAIKQERKKLKEVFAEMGRRHSVLDGITK